LEARLHHRPSVGGPGDFQVLNIKNILVTSDGSENAEAAFPFAVQLATQQAATLHFIYVDDAAQAAAADIERLKKFKAGGSLNVVSHFKKGAPAAQIIDCAKEVSADCIVMATHGRSGIARLLFGSVTERVLRDSPCPVLCVKSGEAPISTGPMLLSSDLSPEALNALYYATALAKDQHCELHIVLVLEEELGDLEKELNPLPQDMKAPTAVEWMTLQHRTMEQKLDQVVADLRSQGIPAVPHIRHGKVAKEVHACAAEIGAHCIVTSTHGRSGLSRLMLGSVAEDIIRTATCAILAVKSTLHPPPELIAPATEAKSTTTP
jgi:nucleotide-binding universal stress UspA family protein